MNITDNLEQENLFASCIDNDWLETFKEFIQDSDLTMQLQMTDDHEYLAKIDQQITQLASNRSAA